MKSEHEEMCRNLRGIAGFLLELTRKFFDRNARTWITTAKIFVEVSMLYKELCIDNELKNQG